MDLIFNLEDEYIKDYLITAYFDNSVTDEDLTETFSAYFTLEEINQIKSERTLYKESIPVYKQNSNLITIPKLENSIPYQSKTHQSTSHEHKQIIDQYSLIPVSNKPCKPFIPELDKKNKKHTKNVRYRNGLIVTNKGEKYITINTSST